MTITAYQQTRAGQTTLVTVTSDLVGAVTYYWYFDGVYLGKSASPSRSLHLREGDQGRVEVLDSQDPDFDPLSEGPADWPARRTIHWTASIDPSVAAYRVDQREASGRPGPAAIGGFVGLLAWLLAWKSLAGPWVPIAVVPHDPLRWSYAITTGRLIDLVEYAWRVVPLDAAGNEGTAAVIGPEKIVRTPDAPDFTAAFDAETGKITFTETA